MHNMLLVSSASLSKCYQYSFHFINTLQKSKGPFNVKSKEINKVHHKFFDVEAKKNVLVQIWKLKFGHKAKFVCSDFQHKIWSRI